MSARVQARQARIQTALDRLPALDEIKQRQGQNAKEARASMSDADATVMKRGNGGFRPAYNVQYGTDSDSQVIVGADVVTTGSDQGPLAPMIGQVNQQCQQSPAQWLVDGGYPAHEQIDAVAEQTTVYAPVPKPKDKDTDPHVPKPGDSEAVAAWRERMGSEAAKAIYKDRAATAECVDGQAREHGMTRFRVRGLAKIKCVTLWFAIAHNLMRIAALAPGLIGIRTGTSGGQDLAT